MTPTSRTRWTRKEFALALAIVAFVGAAAAFSAGLVHPKSVPSAALGAGWQCKTALFLTSCTRTPHAENVVQNPVKNPVCLRRV
jgi:hypothetical protein